MNGSIDYLQEEVSQYEYTLAEAQAIYNGLTSEDNIQAELKEMGYDSSNVNVEAIDVADSVVVEDLKAETNWFDAICNFVSQIFG